VASSARETSAIVGGYDTTIEISSGKPLSELTVVEVSRLLGSIEAASVILKDHLVKPLSELRVDEVVTVLEALKLGKFKETLLSNEIDGKCLMKCNTIEDVKEMGISMTVKASLLLDEIKKWKAAGVPMEYFTAANRADQNNSNVDDNS